jgi:transcriptional regulator with XRE-family HTH domain
MIGAPIKPHAVRPGENHDRDRLILERLSAGGTVRAVAVEFGITHQRVSQIKRRLTGARLGAARRPWSLDRIEQLRRLRREGLTLAAIARELGVSRSAVAGKLHRLRLRSERKRPLPERRQQVARSQ